MSFTIAATGRSAVRSMRMPRMPRRRSHSRTEQLMTMVRSAAPSRGRSRSRSRGGMGKGRMAMLGAGAVAAFTQRDKLAGLFGGGKDDQKTDTPDGMPSDTPRI